MKIVARAGKKTKCFQKAYMYQKPEGLDAYLQPDGSYMVFLNISSIPENTMCELEGKSLGFGKFKVDYVKQISTGINIEKKVENILNVNEKTAKKLTDKYGAKVLDVVENHTSNLLDDFDAKKVVKIKNNFLKNKENEELILFLSNYNIKLGRIKKILQRYENTLEVLKTNPYNLIPFGFSIKLCDRIVSDNQIVLDPKERVKAQVMEMLNVNSTRGNLYLSLSEIEKNLKAKDIEPLLKEMEKDKTIVIRSKQCIYALKNEDDEYNSAQKIIDILNYPSYRNFDKVDELVKNYNIDYKSTLSQKQLEAVSLSLKNNLSVITGGPGTGKTTITQAIIKIYRKLSTFPVILLAPTGKAARRMAEVNRMETSTIHSRLEIYSDDEDPLQTLPKGLVIVDESSMIDQSLAKKLLNSIALGSTVVFVGDVNQLPSVGAGNFLKELIDSQEIPVSRLTEVFRQKGESLIIDNAIKINEGRNDLIFDNKQFVYDECLEEPEAMNKILEEYLKEVELRGLDKVVILTPLRRTQQRFIVVAEELNKVIQDKLNPAKKGEKEFKQFNTVFRVGSRVMQNKNTKDSQNGDIGVITNITSSGVGIDWETGKHSLLTQEEMETITLGYCITIHKSQGSEYETVIIPMLENQKCGLFRRNLLYTAVTRAKKKVVLVGYDGTIADTIEKVDTNKRLTLLSARIKYNINLRKNSGQILTEEKGGQDE